MARKQRIDYDTLFSRQFGRTVTEARSVIAWAVAEFFNGTISEVGRMFGPDETAPSACINRMYNTEVTERMNLMAML